MTDAVSDSGPLIHLSEIGCLHLLRLFTVLHVPTSVWRECVDPGRVPPGAILRSANVVLEEASLLHATAVTEKLRGTRLQPADRDCLVVARALDVPLLLTDDLALRRAAVTLEVVPVGSLGVVLRAWRDGLIESGDAQAALLDLHERSSLFVTRELVELAIRELRSRSD